MSRTISDKSDDKYNIPLKETEASADDVFHQKNESVSSDVVKQNS